MTNDKTPSRAGPRNSSGPVRHSNHSSPGPRPPEPKLLAVDCGLKTGLALFTSTGQLLWYRSHNLGNRARLKKAVRQILQETAPLAQLVIEGGGPFADIWIREGSQRGLQVRQVYAETWRTDLLLPRQQRTGRKAKQVADELAREIIEKSGAARPTSLRHDAAEAILIGWWASVVNCS